MSDDVEVRDRRLLSLLTHLHRGGIWAYWWLNSSSGKQSIWWPVGDPQPISPNGGTNVYFGVHPALTVPERYDQDGGQPIPTTSVRAGITDVAAINCVFAEFDAKDYSSKERLTELVRKLTPRPQVIIASGGGYHCYWLLDDPFVIYSNQDRERARRLQQAWVLLVAGDTGSKDLARVLRVPGFRNYKSEYGPDYPIVDFVRFEVKTFYTLAELEALAAPHMDKAHAPSSPVGQSIPVGQRDKTLASLAGSMRRRGMSEAAILAALRQENADKCNPPLDDAHVVAIAHSISRYTPADNGHSDPPQEPESPPEELAVTVALAEEEAPADVFTTATDDPWGQGYSLTDAYAPREPLQYIVAGLYSLPSMSIVYGAPGTMKSLIFADMAVCVAAGIQWLAPLPGQKGMAKQTLQTPVIWADFDNGARRCHERFGALARARDLPTDLPLRYYSMPTPWLDASNADSIDDLRDRVRAAQAGLVIIDNLGTITGGAEENSSDMVQVMGRLRSFTETTGAVVILIHHQRKGNNFTTRSGDTLRGHSSIEASLDLALLVEREAGAPSVTIRSTKTRGLDVYPFGAQFAFDLLPSGELDKARFFGLCVDDQQSDAAIERTVLEVIRTMGAISQSTLVKSARESLLDVGINRVRRIINTMVHDHKLIVVIGKRGTKQYAIA